MAVCDANYIRILKLLPNLQKGVAREVVIPVTGVVEQAVFIIEVIEKFKYTSTVKISQKPPERKSRFYRPPQMLIRIYHDADTAEVMAYQNHKYFKSIYPFPNKHMYYPDEKEQLNLFLALWLTLCLQRGVSNQEIPVEEYLACAGS